MKTKTEIALARLTAASVAEYMNAPQMIARFQVAKRRERTHAAHFEKVRRETYAEIFNANGTFKNV